MLRSWPGQGRRLHQKSSSPPSSPSGNWGGNGKKGGGGDWKGDGKKDEGKKDDGKKDPNQCWNSRGRLAPAAAVTGAFGQAAISTGDLAGDTPGDVPAPAPVAATVQDSSAALDLSADSPVETSPPVPAPAPALPRAPAKAPAKAPARPKAPALAPARAPSKAPSSKAPSRAPAPKPVARTTSLQSSAPSQARSCFAPAPGPATTGSGNTTADITNVIQARAGVFTRANTLFLAGVSSRVDWTADLAERGKRTGRFRLDYFLSASFNQSDPSGSAWLGNPQAVIWGVKDGAANETSMVAILSEPRYNASGDTLSFAVQPVTEAASLKLSEGTANAALLGDPASRLNSTTVGLILKDIVIYIDDSTGDGPEQAARQKTSLVGIGPWGNAWNPCWGVGRQGVWRDDRVRSNYFGCGSGIRFG
ncbi:hypothetical protein COCSUDRAFT_58514 [Coccomyxa subellipsoidea C-169]|uniref:Uncharacterized protein n=1 Tax=Coccomyxa subellipsoidea (strain C-169) TaxID=574566 RepID=I0YN16_COCSC|nr:hypothetical protein COCSUDRAFT_58514 [Coccomyxa subellipsoidea C-169]EIE19785.1 hypothetical protein COCSUDRAFT_58514 [Coccomyxa subellipsoidea C-169]|eukprot:XP_005644329.1 hypothetical protein COCSUDRAFT_58514 [Coccomyxa subellipsoidea C-169]